MLVPRVLSVGPDGFPGLFLFLLMVFQEFYQFDLMIFQVSSLPPDVHSGSFIDLMIFQVFSFPPDGFPGVLSVDLMIFQVFSFPPRCSFREFYRPDDFPGLFLSSDVRSGSFISWPDDFPGLFLPPDVGFGSFIS
ncbi:hypothetical protein SESBI_09101 [Sesbania bispinosa]|nr:hypothetical protein SESBI_09101 [Sesbania bispinosa]